MIYCYVNYKSLKKFFNYIFVFGFNDESDRQNFWADLKLIFIQFKGVWYIVRDFNNFLNFKDQLVSVIRWKDIV